MRRTLLVALLLILWTTQGISETLDGSVYTKKEEGWFFYNEPIEKEEEIPKQKVAPTESPEQEKESRVVRMEAPAQSGAPKPAPLSSEWIRENLPKLLDAAIDNPTPENVAAYLYVQRVMLDKAQNFTKVSAQVSRLDPLLNEETRFPFSNAMRSGVLRLQDEAKKTALHEIAQKAGIWFFFDSTCSFCPMQYEVVKHLAEDYGFVVFNISLDGQPLPDMEDFLVDNGHSRVFQLRVVPAVALVVPPDNVIVLTQGLLADSSLDERILLVAEQHGLIPENLLKLINLNERGILSPEDIQKAPLSDDPVEIVKYIKQRLEDTYW